MSKSKIERREFVKKAAYAVPVVLTLKAMPAFAAAGSGNSQSSKRGPGGWSGGDSSEKAAGSSTRKGR